MTRILSNSLGLFLFLLVVALFTLQFVPNDTYSPQNSYAETDPPTEVCDLINQLPTEPLSAAEKEALLLMREEEKLARDVYLHLEEKWEHKTFTNISSAEQRHMDAIACLLAKYELDDPIVDLKQGSFKNTELQTLYNNLITKGEENLEAALRVGATIEDLDLYDLKQTMSSIDNQDLMMIFLDLERGSRNHMRAFTKHLGQLDATYEPVHITAEAYQDIISTPKEKGGLLCAGTEAGKIGKNCGGNCEGNCGGHGEDHDHGNKHGHGEGHGHSKSHGNCNGGHDKGSH